MISQYEPVDSRDSFADASDGMCSDKTAESRSRCNDATAAAFFGGEIISQKEPVESPRVRFDAVAAVSGAVLSEILRCRFVLVATVAVAVSGVPFSFSSSSRGGRGRVNGSKASRSEYRLVEGFLNPS